MAPKDDAGRKAFGIFFAVGGPIAAVVVACPTFFLEIFAFDAPYRKTSFDLVEWLLLGALVGEVLGTVAIGTGVYLGDGRPAGLRILVAGAIVTALGVGLHATSLGLALFGG